MAGILVCAEFEDGELRPEISELLAVAEGLRARIEGPVRLALAGWPVGNVIDEARRAGADQVIAIDDQRLVDPWPEGYALAMEELCDAFSPEAVLVSRTLLGVEAAARLAARFGWPLLKDVVRLDEVPDGIAAARPVFGGAVLATVIAHHGPWIIVPRPRAFATGEPKASDVAPVAFHELSLARTPKTHCGTRSRNTSSSAKDVERSRILIAGGAGLGGPEPFHLLSEIAELVGGAVAASRVPCDAGWVPSDLQVGLTGKTVAPDLYLAVGISGAAQHLAGCASAQTIAVVNSDETAPFFRLANYGVVGDWKEVMAGFRDALKENLQISKSGT